MEIVNPTVEETHRLDLLDRQEFVDRMLTIAAALSDNKKNSCYAVNGDWGVGKSFVLDMFEEQAGMVGVEGETLSRYLIFRYNCWQYDYYEEPLVAIVASMLDQIDEKVDLIPADIKEKTVAVLKVIGKGLVKKAVKLIEDKTGVDLDEVIETLKDGGEKADKAVRDSHEYDQDFDFRKKLQKLRETVGDLSENQTIIFIVDELDRCLPEYTIKVLERLHHLFEGVSNVQVILSIDGGQLEHVVQQIYGEKTDAKSYLRKFIQFELALTEGEIKNHFDERFKNYLQHFEIQAGSTRENEVEEFKLSILNGLDMRKRITIIDQCELIHSLLYKSAKADASVLCLEVFLTILNDYGINPQYAKQVFQIDSVFEKTRLKRNATATEDVPEGLSILSAKYRKNRESESCTRKLYDKRTEGNETITYVNAGCLVGKILCAYRSILGFSNDHFFIALQSEDIVSFIEYARQFWGLLQIVH